MGEDKLRNAPTGRNWLILAVAGSLALTGCAGGGGAIGSLTASALPSRPASPSRSTLPTRTPSRAPTQAPTTQAPTTQAPTTQAPTTQAPTTQAPTTQAPTTQAPTTQPPTTQAPTGSSSAAVVTSSPASPGSTASASSSSWVWVALAALLLIVVVVAVIARRRANRNGLHATLTETVRSGTQAHEHLAADLATVSADRTIPASLAESERLLDVFTGQLASLAIPPDQPGLLAARADLAEATASLRESLRPLLGATSLSLGTMARDATTHLTMFEAALGRFRDAAEVPHA